MQTTLNCQPWRVCVNNDRSKSEAINIDALFIILSID